MKETSTSVPLDLLHKFIRKVKKDHPELDKYDNIMIENDGHSISFHGYYDCPPIYFRYKYGMEQGWKLKKIK